MDPKRLKKIKRNDRLGQWVITIGGIAIIVSVVAILLLIAKEAIPLFRKPRHQTAATLQPVLPAQASVQAIGLDEYMETGFILSQEGTFTFFDLTRGKILDAHTISRPDGARAIRNISSPGDLTYTFTWDNGAVTLETVVFQPRFDRQGKRAIIHEVKQLAAFSAPNTKPILRSLARHSDDNVRTCVSLLEDKTFRVIKQVHEENFPGEETITEHEYTIPVKDTARIETFALDRSGQKLFTGTDTGYLMGWSLSDPETYSELDSVAASGDHTAINALTFVFGGESLAVGDAEGHLTTWSLVPVNEAKKQLHPLHTLQKHQGSIQGLWASQRNKSILSLSKEGRLHLDHMTSERSLIDLDPALNLSTAALSLRGNSLIGLTRDGEIHAWKIDVPHPETSTKTLFGKVWYEGYAEPEYVWQSSSMSDDFEPKLSLVPLIFGSIKGTFYAMLISVPLALLGALYTSQFTTYRVRSVIKPTIEVMAAIPSVVVGFLAALWFAPLVERNLSSFFLSLGILPVMLVLAILLWQWLRRWKPLRVIETGYEFAALVPFVMGGIFLAWSAGPWIEQTFFTGNLKLWFYRETGIQYDPRNCIIIAFALGFAVIPIIFTIAEDAFSNVPHSLTAASLALGASRWQTVWLVVLPSASPGIFAGIVIGLGRAVGETMIVLMATGNTPIMDWSIFNGMRTLSANITVEIPEAPFGGTLYRVLFLSAVVLFLMTFVLNTMAELVRQRLRAKYARFQ